MIRSAGALVVALCAGCGFGSEGLGGDPIALDDHDAEQGRADTAVGDTDEPRDSFDPDTFAVDTFVADTLEPDVAPEAPTPCSEAGGALWSGHCYFPLPTARAFGAQRDACDAVGAHLATITSAEEQAVVAARGSGDRWIGLVKDPALPSAKSSFKWITGESAAAYDNWSAGDPNGGHNCARMMATGAWGDQACTNTFPAVCERE